MGLQVKSGFWTFFVTIPEQEVLPSGIRTIWPVVRGISEE